MPPIRNGTEESIAASIRANIVFEKMIVSVLTIAAAGGAVHFLIGLALRAKALSLGGIGSALFGAVSFALLFFLAGFATALAVGIPLYRLLETAKRRNAWPYCLAALAVSFLILAALGLTPSVEAPARALYLAPGLCAALLFARKMRPFWKAAARAEEARDVIRLQ